MNVLAETAQDLHDNYVEDAEDDERDDDDDNAANEPTTALDILQEKNADPEFISKVKEKLAKLDSTKSELERINADRQEVRKSLKAMGLDVKAIDAAISYNKLEEQQGVIWDMSYKIARSCLGRPLQAELF